MIAFAEKVRAYTPGFDRAGFVGDSRTYDATLRREVAALLKEQ